jgi:hypothetical protein
MRKSETIGEHVGVLARSVRRVSRLHVKPASQSIPHGNRALAMTETQARNESAQTFAQLNDERSVRP